MSDYQAWERYWDKSIADGVPENEILGADEWIDNQKDKELENLRLFKRLACRAFEYPRDIEMMGFTQDEKQFLYDAMTGEDE